MASQAPAHLPLDKPVVLQDPPYQPDPQRPRRYGISTFFQVSPTQVALFANRRVTRTPVVDHEDGFDIFVFDDLAQLTPDRAEPGVYQHPETHPITGESLVMVPHLPVGGFVPLGAKLPDGRDHPAAGTGFGLDAVVGHPSDHHSPVPLHRGTPNHSYQQIYQFRFDGEKFEIVSRKQLPKETVLGWHLGRRGLSPALQDGEDLITVMTGGIEDEHVEAYFDRLKQLGREPKGLPLGPCRGAVFARWRYQGEEKGWQIVEINRIVEPGPDMSGEPTLVRDADGSLLCSVRSKGADVEPGERDETGMENLYQAFRVYRSTDNGKTWARHLCELVVRSASPVTINKFGDGTVFIAANPTLPLETDSKGRTVPMHSQRQRMWIWPLTDDRRSIKDPLCVLDAVEKLGPPRPLESFRADNRWMLDHPLALPVRLGDGNWHNLLSFRVTDSATNSGGADAPPEGGLWTMTIPGNVESPYPWQFSLDD